MTAHIRVRITPRAGRDAIAGWRDDGLLLVRVAAPPDGGRANAALEELLAGALGVPKSAVHVATGSRGREKTVAIQGIEQNEAVDKLRKAIVP